jgi:hypothetical protein
MMADSELESSMRRDARCEMRDAMLRASSLEPRLCVRLLFCSHPFFNFRLTVGGKKDENENTILELQAATQTKLEFTIYNTEHRHQLSLDQQSTISFLIV